MRPVVEWNNLGSYVEMTGLCLEMTALPHAHWHGARECDNNLQVVLFPLIFLVTSLLTFIDGSGGSGAPMCESWLFTRSKVELLFIIHFLFSLFLFENWRDNSRPCFVVTWRPLLMQDCKYQKWRRSHVCIKDFFFFDFLLFDWKFAYQIREWAVAALSIDGCVFLYMINLEW